MIRQQFQTFFGKHSIAHLILSSSDCKVLDCNDAILDIFELSDKEEIIGQFFSNLKISGLGYLSQNKDTIRQIVNENDKCSTFITLSTTSGKNLLGNINMIDLDENHFLVSIELISTSRSLALSEAGFISVIDKLLSLQSSYVKDENSLNILREIQNKIKSISFIHESLCRT
ncbi:MAG: hypothetical protein MI810_02750, partial [Flavobacteriales bacterium]|nr:hypothetical protein [Flavobacteriales bacterium]